MQNHLRTFIPKIGQVETDEIYMAIDKNGVHYVVTVQAKGGNDQIGIVQIEQDLEICRHKFKDLDAKPIAAQFIEKDLICLFEFAKYEGEIKIVQEKHYRLVPAEELSLDDLISYKRMPGN